MVLSTTHRRIRRVYLLCTAVLALCFSVVAKENDATPVNAIVVFDAPSGPAYVQVSGLMLNGKTELRVCDGVPKFDKRAYDLLPRIQLTGATSLERGKDGVLKLVVNGSNPICVVPSGLKFTGNVEFTPADAAEQAIMQGTLVSASVPQPGLPALKPGVQLVFVAASDIELAEYLRVQRTNTLNDWQNFLRQYSSSPHAANARNAIAGIIEHSAESTFSQYQKSAAARQPDLALLKQAREQAQEANRTVSGY